MPELSFLRILILGCDRDVDDDEDAGVDAVVQNPCHSLDCQFFKDEFVFFNPRLGRPCVLLRNLLYKMLELDP